MITNVGFSWNVARKIATFFQIFYDLQQKNIFLSLPMIDHYHYKRSSN